VNIVIANERVYMIESLKDFAPDEKDVGVFDPEQITEKYKNLFYDRIIIDITAIRNYHVISNIQRVTLDLDASKIILLLDDSELCASPQFLSALVSMGVYNFASNLESLEYLLNNPNQYKDVVHYQDLGRVDAHALEGRKNINNAYHIIGIKNITEHAGATTLAYMMYKELNGYYEATAITAGADFAFFYDKEISCSAPELLGKEIGRHASKDVIIVDLNDSDEKFCDVVLYLIEPSTLKLNKLFKNGTTILETLKEKKVILNLSNLNEVELEEFEGETGLQTFAQVSSLNDKNIGHEEITTLLLKLGFNRVGNNEKNGDKKSIFVDLFKNI